MRNDKITTLYERLSRDDELQEPIITVSSIKRTCWRNTPGATDSPTLLILRTTSFLEPVPALPGQLRKRFTRLPSSCTEPPVVQYKQVPIGTIYMTQHRINASEAMTLIADMLKTIADYSKNGLSLSRPCRRHGRSRNHRKGRYSPASWVRELHKFINNCMSGLTHLFL